MTSRKESLAFKGLISALDTEYPDPVRVEQLGDISLLKAMIKLAETNGLFYYLSCKLEKYALFSNIAGKKIEAERSKVEEYRRTLSLLNQAAQGGLSYLIIKTPSSVPHIPRDIDIFLASEEREKFCQELIRSGMKPFYNSDVETSFIGKRYMEIDVYSGIRYFGVDFFDEAFFSSSRAKSEIFGVESPVLNREANFLVLLIHSLFGHRVISLLDFLYLKSTLNQLNMELCLSYASTKGWEKVLLLALQQLKSLHKKIYIERQALSFPYLFERSFLMECFSSLARTNGSKFSGEYFSLQLSLFIDMLVHQVRKLPFYNFVASIRPFSRQVTRLGLLIRASRGDSKK